ncbi:hypothetical protein L1887_38097 [Cichorium endivia]|nr:hypothetical protein L1887_38097 [Cichorium endivia]
MTSDEHFKENILNYAIFGILFVVGRLRMEGSTHRRTSSETCISCMGSCLYTTSLTWAYFVVKPNGSGLAGSF